MPREGNRRLTALAVAMTLVLAAVLAVAVPGLRSAPEVAVEVGGASGPAAGSGPASAFPADTDLQPRMAVRAAAPAATAWLLTGRCVDASHRPVAGARVRASVRHAAGAEAPVGLEQWLRADEEGAFQWQLPGQDGAVFVRLEADPEHWLSTPREVVLNGETPPDPVELRLLPLDLILRGRVTDAAGAPIAGATLGLGLHATRTAACDADGRYTLRGASRVAGHRLFARAPGYASQSTLVPDSRHAREHVLDFTLGPEAVVVGTVRDPAGAPIAGALVSSVMSWTSTRTGADGAYRLAGQDPTARYGSVAVECPGFVTSSQRIELHGATTRHDVVLRRGVALAGLVVDSGQRPVAGAAVRVDTMAGPFSAPAAVSDREGRFLLPCLEPVAHALFASHATAGVAVATVVPPTEAPIRLVLGAARQIRGVVASAAGEPVPHAEVRFAMRDLESGSCRADGEGRFAATGLPDAQFYLEAFAPGWQQILPDPKSRLTPADIHTQRSETIWRPFRGEGPIAAGRTDVVLVMARSAGLAGRVVDDRTGQPIPRFRIRFVRVVEKRPEDKKEAGGYGAAWVRDGLWFADPAGTWSTGEETLPAGQPFAVEAWAEGYAPAIAERVLARVDPSPDDCVLRLRTGSVLAGQVVRKDDRTPLASAVVRLVPARHPLTDQNYPHPTNTTGADGSFRFADVAPGEVSLLVQAAGLPTVLDGPLAVRADIPLSHTVVLGAGAVCSGVVLDDNGRPLPHADLELRPQEVPAASTDRAARRARADADGRFRFEALCAGLYQLSHRISDAPMPTYTTRWVLLGRDEARDFTFDPRSGTATLRATVLVDGVPPAHVVFELRYVRERNGTTIPWTELPPMYSRRAAGGVLELGKLAAGTVVVGMRIKPAHGPMMYRSETVVLTEGAVTERVFVR